MLVQDYTFNFPSTAAGVFLGRSTSGRIEWKDEEGRSLREIQEAALGDESGEPELTESTSEALEA